MRTSSTTQHIHGILKKAGFQRSITDKSSMVRGYHTRSYGYYLDVEKIENPNWGINSYKRRQRGRWLDTGRITIRHTDDSQLSAIAKVLVEAGVMLEETDNKIIAGDRMEWVKREMSK